MRMDTVTSPRSAFTLVEILIVIAIIALLAALLFPAFSRARESSRQTTCVTNLHQISIAVQQYFQDERRYPDSLVDLLPEGSKYDDGTPSPTPIPTIGPNVSGYLKNGSDGLLCPDDDLPNDTPRSSYGSLKKSPNPPVASASPAVTGTSADPNGDVGKYAFNYWGYDADGFAYPDADAVSQAGLSPSFLVYQTVEERSQSGPPTTLTGSQVRFNTPAMSSGYDANQRPGRNIVRYSLANRFAPPSTIVTHCMFHRIQTADNLSAPGQLGQGVSGTSDKNARDIVLRLDGSAKSVLVPEWKSDPTGNKWQNQTP